MKDKWAMQRVKTNLSHKHAQKENCNFRINVTERITSKKKNSNITIAGNNIGARHSGHHNVGQMTATARVIYPESCSGPGAINLVHLNELQE